MFILLLLFILNFFVLIITFVSIIGSQNGNSKIGILIDKTAPNYFSEYYDSPFKNYYLSHATDKYYIIFGNKSASLDKIFFAFIIVAVLLTCDFILIFLKISYFRRALVDYIVPLRNYTAKLFSVEENGQIINLDSINIIPSTINQKKIINGKEENENIQVYTRRILHEGIADNNN